EGTKGRIKKSKSKNCKDELLDAGAQRWQRAQRTAKGEMLIAESAELAESAEKKQRESTANCFIAKARRTQRARRKATARRANNELRGVWWAGCGEGSGIVRHVCWRDRP